MKFVPVTVSFTLEGEYGDSQFCKSFQDAQDALAYIGGYIGAHPATIKDIDIDFDWT